MHDIKNVGKDEFVFRIQGNPSNLSMVRFKINLAFPYAIHTVIKVYSL